MTRLRRGAFSVIGSIMAALAAAAQTAFYTVSQDDFYQTVTNPGTYARPLLDNAWRKAGAGTVTLQNPRMTRAELDVLGGGVAITLDDAFTPPELPAALQQKVTFWVDANTNAVADGGGLVSRWHDVREASVDGPYHYMFATNAEVARQPALVADAGLGGKKVLDFGYWGDQDTNVNSRWLVWAGTNGVSKTLDLRSAFIVFGSHNGNTGMGGGICLIQNTSSLAAPAAPWAGAQDRLWASTGNTLADKGINYLDREMRDGRNLQIFNKAYHLSEVLALQAAKANDFAKDRTYPGYSGGSRICEALLFTDEVTEAERLQIEDYLWHKWFGRNDSSLGSVALANAATLDLDTGTNSTQVTVSGDGTVNKEGSGTLALLNGGTDSFDGTVRLRSGSLLVAGEPFLFQLEEGGQTLDVEGVSVDRADGGVSGEIVKTGGGELAVAAVDASVTKIAVTEGSLRLATPRTGGPVPAADGAVNAGNLEVFTNGVPLSTGYLNFTGAASQPPFTTNGWTFDRSAYSSGGFLVGIAFDYTSSIIPAGSAPEGHAVLYLNRGTVSTTVDIPTNGFYRLTFLAATRGSIYTNRHVEVQLDGVTLRTITTPTTAYWKHAIRLPYLTAGTHTVGFKGVGPDNALVAMIDDIQVCSVRACESGPVQPAVINAGFELSLEMIEAGTIVTNEPAGLGWTFSGLAGIGRFQAQGSSSRSMPRVMPDGVCAGMLPLTGGISQSVTFPTSGVYRLSFSAAARIGLVGHSFNVMFGGELVRSLTMTDTAFRRYEIMLPEVATGATRELAFVGTGGANTASLLDDVVIERVGELLDTGDLQNGGFEAVTTESPLVTTNWDGTSYFGVVSNVNAWGESVPCGKHMAYTSMTHSFSQTVTFAASGSYALRFVTKTRAIYAFPKYHDFDVFFGDTRVSRIRNMGGDVRSYELPLQPVTAGVPYVLQFKGVQSYPDAALSLYDQIEIVPAAEARPRVGLEGRFPGTTALDIAAGAGLVLDFEGQIKADTVRYAGHTVSGTISAATHPEFVSGTGSILSPAKGTCIAIQ